ncbi:MAG: SpoIIE family protein phosphatase [Bacteroidales bacterium]|nr:SpoIIE family protein phosphatase [Bacteroidales bacterium]
MQKLKVLVFTLFLLVNYSVYSQDKTLDDLFLVFNEIDINEKPDEALDILDKIYEYTNINQPQLATEYIARALFICDSIIQDSSKSIEWKEKLAIIYLEEENLDQAMRYIVEVKNYYYNTGDSLKYAYSLYYLGNIYTALNVPEIATQEYDKALGIFLRFNEKKGLVLVNIQKSSILYDAYDVEAAFEELFKTLKQIDDDAELKALVNKAIGVLYAEEYDVDSAYFFLSQAVIGFTEAENFVYVADCYVELGKLYIENEEFESAEDYLKKAEALYNEFYAKHKLATTSNLLGYSNFLQNKFSSSIGYLNLGLDAALNYENNDEKLFAYDYLAQIYSKQGNLKLANEYLNLYNEELNNNFEKIAEQGYAEVILTFQNEEKQKEIELLEKEDALKSQLLKNKQQQIYGAILVMVLLLLFAILLYYYMQKQKKVNKLLQEQNRKINLQKKEIESQSKILEKATRNLVHQKDEIQNKNKKITSSINYASRIQKSMLAPSRVFEKYFEDHFILYKPKETVSGDFYWISEIREQKPSLFKLEENDFNKIVVAVVDCTGHGVPGAFMSMLGDAYLNQIINVQHIYDPSKILEELHKAIRATLQQEHTENNDGMDVALCVIDKKNRTLEYSGAKNPLVYVQNDKMFRIHGDLMSIGGLQREKERIFEKHTIDITTKTYIYLYSDGYQDQFGGEFGRKFMAVQFRDVLLRNHKESFEKQRQELITEFKNWKGKKYSQMDDITVVGFTL